MPSTAPAPSAAVAEGAAAAAAAAQQTQQTQQNIDAANPATDPASPASSASATTPAPTPTGPEAANMEPRVILGSAALLDVFCTHTCEHLPDISERPDIPVANVQFWMMDAPVEGALAVVPKPKRNRKSKGDRRYPRPHSLMKGMCGKRFNDSIDNTIKHNKWCATFRDEDGVLINLVDYCIVACWVHYIAYMVRLFYVTPTSISFALYEILYLPYVNVDLPSTTYLYFPYVNVDLPSTTYLYFPYVIFISPLCVCRRVTRCHRVMRVN